jgi:hypothetical protein
MNPSMRPSLGETGSGDGTSEPEQKVHFVDLGKQVADIVRKINRKEPEKDQGHQARS